MKDREAVFRRIFRENYPVLMRVVFRITGREDLAEEIVQEAMIKFYERIDQLPHDETARYWLLRVARNLALNVEKRRQRERRVHQRLVQLRNNTPAEEGPETSLIREAEKSQIQRALLELPFNQRVVLVLKEYLDFTYEEIAKTLGITENNVKVRVHRARTALAARLKKEVSDGVAI